MGAAYILYENVLQMHPHALPVLHGLACTGVFGALRPISKALIPGFNNFSDADKWTWYNRGTAMVHTSLIFIGAAHYFLNVNPTWELIMEQSTIEKMLNDNGMRWRPVATEAATEARPCTRQVQGAAQFRSCSWRDPTKTTGARMNVAWVS